MSLSPHTIIDITQMTWDEFVRQSLTMPGFDFLVPSQTKLTIPFRGPGPWELFESPVVGGAYAYTQDPLTKGSGTTLALNLEIGVAERNSEIRVFKVDQFGQKIPEFIAVSMPKTLEIDPQNEYPQSFPFIVYFHATPDNEETLFRASPRPLGHAWLNRYLSNILNGLIIDRATPPKLEHQVGLKGLPFQIARSGKPFVHVHFIMPWAKGIHNPVYRFQFADEVEKTLLGVQKFFLDKRMKRAYRLPDLKWVTLSAFSNGTNVLGPFINKNLIGSAIQKRFVQEVVKEVYIFDPPQPDWAGDAIISNALEWFDKSAHRSIAALRMYTQHSYSALPRLVPNKKFETPDHDGYFESSGPRAISLAFLKPNFSNDIWTHTRDDILRRTAHEAARRHMPVREFIPSVLNWLTVHHLVPELMLTHALLKSKLTFYQYNNSFAPDYKSIGL